MIGVLDATRTLNDNAPPAYRGLDRFVARERILADLEAQGLLERIEDHVSMIAARRAQRRRRRADADRPVVRAHASRLRRRPSRPWSKGASGSCRRTGRTRLLRLDAQHPGLVHLAPALVGSSDSRVVRRRGQRLRRRATRPRRGEVRPRPPTYPSRRTRTCSTPGSPRRSGRSRRSAGRTRRRSSRPSIPPACSSRASTSSSSGSRA